MAGDGSHGRPHAAYYTERRSRCASQAHGLEARSDAYYKATPIYSWVCFRCLINYLSVVIGRALAGMLVS